MEQKQILFGLFSEFCSTYENSNINFRNTKTNNALVKAADMNVKKVKEENEGKFNYNGLWKLLIDEGMLKRDLMQATGITSSTVAKMGKGQPISMQVIWKICCCLNCDIGDIVSIEISNK